MTHNEVDGQRKILLNNLLKEMQANCDWPRWVWVCCEEMGCTIIVVQKERKKKQEKKGDRKIDRLLFMREPSVCAWMLWEFVLSGKVKTNEVADPKMVGGQGQEEIEESYGNHFYLPG